MSPMVEGFLGFAALTRALPSRSGIYMAIIQVVQDCAF